MNKPYLVSNSYRSSVYFWSRANLDIIVSDYGLDDWTTGRSKFEPRQRQKDFSSSLCVRTGSVAFPASFPIGSVSPFPRG
jgi:hypothetical protein